MADKKVSSSLTFPLRQVTEIKIRGIDKKGAWLSLLDDEENSIVLDIVQFQKAVRDEHGYFFYSKKNSNLKATIEEWLPDGFYCQDGEVFDNGPDTPLVPTGNYWPLIVFLVIMFGGLLM